LAFVGTRGTLAIHSPNPLFLLLETFLLLGGEVSTVGMFQFFRLNITSEYNMNNPFLFIFPLSLPPLSQVPLLHPGDGRYRFPSAGSLLLLHWCHSLVERSSVQIPRLVTKL